MSTLLGASEMVAHFAVAVAVIFAAFALIFNRNTIKLQRQTLQAHLFKDISDRISRLQDEFPKCETLKDKEDWYERLFVAFEYFAFFANRHYLSADMKYYFKSGLEDCCERLETKYPDLLKHFRGLPPEQMNEFKKYFEDITGKKPPF